MRDGRRKWEGKERRMTVMRQEGERLAKERRGMRGEEEKRGREVDRRNKVKGGEGKDMKGEGEDRGGENIGECEIKGK